MLEYFLLGIEALVYWDIAEAWLQFPRVPVPIMPSKFKVLIIHDIVWFILGYYGKYWLDIGILGYLSIGILEWCRSWVAVSQGGSAKLRSALPSLRSHPNGSACSSRPGL